VVARRPRKKTRRAEHEGASAHGNDVLRRIGLMAHEYDRHLPPPRAGGAEADRADRPCMIASG
jgi:hypothetical protein